MMSFFPAQIRISPLPPVLVGPQFWEMPIAMTDEYRNERSRFSSNFSWDDKVSICRHST